MRRGVVINDMLQPKQGVFRFGGAAGTMKSATRTAHSSDTATCLGFEPQSQS